MSAGMHTPGPWHLGDGTGDPVQSCSIYAHHPATGRLYMVCTTTGYFAHPARLYNAHLIAAAPDMLDALRRASTNLRNTVFAGQADDIDRLIAKAAGSAT